MYINKKIHEISIDKCSKSLFFSMITPALRNSLTSLVHPFYVPGSQLLLNPDIYVTVIAWTPFIAEGAQAVLCQGISKLFYVAKLISNYFYYYYFFTLGCLVTPNNVEEVIKSIVYRLDELEKRSFEVSADVNNVMSNMRAEAERLTYGLFEEETSVSRSVSMLPSVATSTADSGFIAMIRTGEISFQKIYKLSFQLLVVFSRIVQLAKARPLKVLLYHFHRYLV